MPMKMIDVDSRNVEANGHTLSERSAYQKGTQKSRASGEGNGIKVGNLNSGLTKSFADNRENILLMCAARELRDHAAKPLVDFLAPYDIAEEYSLSYHCC